MTEEEWKKRMENPQYNNLIVTTHQDNKPYVFVSYKSDSWELVLTDIVHTLQKEYGLRVYFDKSFNNNNNIWTEQFPPNMSDPNCKAVLAFIDDKYYLSYATLLELMYSQTYEASVGIKKGEGLPVIPVNLQTIKEISSELGKEDTGLGVETLGDGTKNFNADEEKKLFDDTFKELNDRDFWKRAKYLYKGKELTKSVCSITMGELYKKLKVSENPYKTDMEQKRFYDPLVETIKSVAPEAFDDNNSYLCNNGNKLSQDKVQEIKEIDWKDFDSVKSFSYNNKYFNVKTAKSAYVAIVDIVRSNNQDFVTKDIIDGETPYYVSFEDGQELDMPNGGYGKILKSIPEIGSSVKLYSDIYDGAEYVKEFEILKLGENVSSKEVIEADYYIVKDVKSVKENEIIEHKVADHLKEEVVELDWVNWNKKLPSVKPYTFQVEFMGRKEEHIKIWKDVWRKTIDIICVNPEIREKFSKLREDIIKNEGSLKTFFCGQKSKSGDSFSTKYEIESLGFAVESYWNQEGFSKEIIKLLGELDINLNKLNIYGILENSNEVGRKLTPFTNQSIQQKNNLIKYQVDGEEFETTQNEMMYKIFQLILKEHPESLIQVIDKMQCVSYVNKIKRKEDDSDVLSYYRNFKEMEIAGNKIIIGFSFSVEGKISQIKSLMSICGEDFEQRIKIQSLDREKQESKSKRQGNMFFHCFGEKYEEYTGADFITIVVQKLFEQYPDRIILGDIITDNPNNNFRGKNSFEIEEKVYYVDTHSSTVSKYKSIKKLMQKMRIEPYNERVLTVKDKADDELEERTIGELTER